MNFNNIKSRIKDMLLWFISVVIVGFGLWICDGTLWKEIILALLVLIGVNIRNE